jgi:hypothetical protein
VTDAETPRRGAPGLVNWNRRPMSKAIACRKNRTAARAAQIVQNARRPLKRNRGVLTIRAGVGTADVGMACRSPRDGPRPVQQLPLQTRIVGGQALFLAIAFLRREAMGCQRTRRSLKRRDTRSGERRHGDPR